MFDQLSFLKVTLHIFSMLIFIAVLNAFFGLETWITTQ